ncbi:hypothetical protein [Plantactinospora endophytica]|uniref:Uncharacterized protein n=1 Tax=Plantactinospora endophytica TaxID=673535 RepID=A0ABQ4DXB6_9ACTN|nr:hypothetical protein [Plantactinospora endophytica]GIG87103.1 hypothetical protein Pen02_20390 [Plantactinospora endophytica]
MDQATSVRSPAPPGTRWLLAALLLTALVSVLLLFLPVVLGSRSSTVGDPDGGGQLTGSAEVRQSLLEVGGWGVAVLLLVPVLLCAVPLLAPGSVRPPLTVAVTVLLGMGVLVSLASIGLCYLPSLALLVAAAVRLSRRPTTPTT